MNAEYWAALGCRRGSGESLASWLRAGPLRTQEIERPASSLGVEGDLYCPACHVDDAGRRRWYTREEWTIQDVVCMIHALPLVRTERPPASLRSRRWPTRLRHEFGALAAWTQQGSGGKLGRAILRAISARTDPRVDHSHAWAEAQWCLWISGWPVPAAPWPVSRGPFLFPWRQADRLALMAITHRVAIALETGQGPGWRTLPIHARALRWVQSQAGPVTSCFRNIEGANANS